MQDGREERNLAFSEGNIGLSRLFHEMLHALPFAELTIKIYQAQEAPVYFFRSSRNQTELIVRTILVPCFPSKLLLNNSHELYSN